jgi:hypothetical protein
MTTYNPVPPRVWSRVQNKCTYVEPTNPTTFSLYIPFTKQTVGSEMEAIEIAKMINKGNILQYKANSAQLTKSQKYAQLARCSGPSRRKVFATQTETYTNPNTNGLFRKGFSEFYYPNEIVGSPNNISGPFAYGVIDPNDCSNNFIRDGGTLVCGTYADPCTNEIIKTGKTSAITCNPASASNVPGQSILCWNNSIQTWFPKTRYTMNNSTDKWPVNYKGFVSAVGIKSPVVSFIGLEDSIQLMWSLEKSNIPIKNYNIYIDNTLHETLNGDIFNTYISNTDLNETITAPTEPVNKSVRFENIKTTANNKKVIKVEAIPISNLIQSSYGSVIYTKNSNSEYDETNCGIHFFNKIFDNTAIVEVNTLLVKSNTSYLNIEDETNYVNLNIYTQLKIQIEELKQSLNENNYLIRLIDLFQNILTNLFQSYNMKMNYISQLKTTATYKESHDILNDRTKLDEYIKSLKKNMDVINVTIQSTYAKVNPLYKIYIQLYGIPENHNFVPEILNTIENDLEKYHELYGIPENNVYDISFFSSKI